MSDFDVLNTFDFRDGWNALLLGNGASIELHPKFTYSSLYSRAKELDLIDSSLDKLFEYFNKIDFEFVLQLLWHAALVNEALETKERATKEAYERLRDALIKTIMDIHCEPSDIENDMQNLASFASNFKMIISLNYDLTLYWIMMNANRKFNYGNWFKDCFLSGKFKNEWEELKNPYGAKGVSLVFYPHGNLILATTQEDEEVKIRADAFDNLLSTIAKYWRSGRYFPLFVSEGDSQQKLRAIKRSDYLRTVYKEVLPQIGKSLVVYGWSFSDNDLHIIQALKKGNIKRIAVSVHAINSRRKAYCERVSKIITEHFKTCNDLRFFDSKAPGCWRNPSGQEN